jgi:hypothetical protein
MVIRRDTADSDLRGPPDYLAKLRQDTVNLEARIRRWAAARPPLSHRLLIARDPDEVARLRAELWTRRRQPESVQWVQHDADRACCNAEPWEETLKILVEKGGAT